MKVSDLINDLEKGDRSDEHLKEDRPQPESTSLNERLAQIALMQNAFNQSAQGGQLGQLANQQQALNQSQWGQVFYASSYSPFGIRQGPFGGLLG